MRSRLGDLNGSSCGNKPQAHRAGALVSRIDVLGGVRFVGEPGYKQNPAHGPGYVYNIIRRLP